MSPARLDDFFPRWHYRERHHRWVGTLSGEDVMRAVEAATWGDFPCSARCSRSGAWGVGSRTATNRSS